jgi:carbonic anhydrase
LNEKWSRESPVVEIATSEVRSPDDVETVRELILEYADWLDVDLCFQDFDAEMADLAATYAPPAGQLYLVRVDGEPAACIGLKPIAAAGEAEVKRLYVRPAYRGHGIARALVTRIIEDARAAGYRTLRLDTLAPRMPEAEALYRSFGFGLTPPYYYNPYEGVVFYALDL